MSFNLGMMIDTTRLYIFISGWMTLTFIQSHSCMKNETNFGVHFLANLIIHLGEIESVVLTCWFVEIHAKLSLLKYCSRERTLMT